MAKWIIAPKPRLPKIQFSDHMKLKKEEKQSVDGSVLLRSGNKIPMGRNTATKCGIKTEGKAIQRLPHWGSIPYTVTKTRHYCGCQAVFVFRNLIWLSPERHCQSMTNTDVDVWVLTTNSWSEHRDPNGRVRKKNEGSEGVCNPIGRTTMSTY